MRNPLFTPFVFTDEMLDMPEEDFKKLVKAAQPEIILLEEQKWRVFSADECKLKFDTHDPGSNSRNCEKIIRHGVDDSGETLSAKSGCCMSLLAGSHANLDPFPPFVCVAADQVDPAWFVGCPVATVNGIDFPMDYSCNPKGSVLPEVYVA